jgi:Skp family chaperone for outer membrane proteins
MKIRLLIGTFLLIASSSFAQQAPSARGAVAPPAAAQAPLPFPAGAKVAYVNLQAIAGNSAEGKADNAKVEALVKRKQGEAPANQKTPQDAQKFQQDAQAEVQKLQADLQNDFQRKLFPVLQQMAKDKQLSMLLSSQDAGLIWADPALDLTAEAIKRLDAATSAPKPAAKK